MDPKAPETIFKNKRKKYKVRKKNKKNALPFKVSDMSISFSDSFLFVKIQVLFYKGLLYTLQNTSRIHLAKFYKIITISKTDSLHK